VIGHVLGIVVADLRFERVDLPLEAARALACVLEFAFDGIDPVLLLVAFRPGRRQLLFEIAALGF